MPIIPEFVDEVLALREQKIEEVEAVLRAYQAERQQFSASTIGERPDGSVRPHAFTCWLDLDFDPSATHIRWFSADRRVHSQNVVNPPAQNDGVAYVSGAFAADQRVSRPVIGLTFESEARLVPPGSERDATFQRWIENKLFKESEVEKYLGTGDPDVPSHQVYEATVTNWTLMDGNQQPRLVVLGNDECAPLEPGELRFGMHNFNPHLHLPLSLE